MTGREIMWRRRRGKAHSRVRGENRSEEGEHLGRKCIVFGNITEGEAKERGNMTKNWIEKG